MNHSQQYNKTQPPNSANGSSQNLNSNNNQYPKSMDDWLNSNLSNGNTNNDAIRSSHLDDWLNATMKDSPKTFSVSSTEFLDGPARNVINANGLGSIGMVMPPVNLLRMMPESYQVISVSLKYRWFFFFNFLQFSPYILLFVSFRTKAILHLSTILKHRHTFEPRILHHLQPRLKRPVIIPISLVFRQLWT